MISFFGKFKRIIAAYYWAAYSLHHAVCLRPGRPLKNTKLIVIGSFRAGGAGKTPFCLWLAKRLTARGKRVAVLCHQYAFDEIQMYRNHLKEEIQQGLAEIIKTDNRYRTARELDRRNRQGKAGNCTTRTALDFILCDDGFEDSRLRPYAIFRLDWEKAPTEIHQLIPAGKFRSLRQDHFKDEPRTTVLRCYGTNPDVLFRIDSITNSDGEFPQYRQSIAICGLGDPERFIRDLRRAEFSPRKTIIRPDHDRHFQKYVLETLHQHCQENIIISEKDSFRLLESQLNNPRVYVARQAIQICDSARAKIDYIFGKGLEYYDAYQENF